MNELGALISASNLGSYLLIKQEQNITLKYVVVELE